MILRPAYETDWTQPLMEWNIYDKSACYCLGCIHVQMFGMYNTYIVVFLTSVTVWKSKHAEENSMTSSYIKYICVIYN